MSSPPTLVALAGQPNCGKSTVFNALSGAKQHVANYPGVTVDKMVGWTKYNGDRFEIVDLPGAYSLTSYSPEERVTRDFLLHEKPALVINVTDASNLKRNLYLTFQLLEMEIPLILNLNMMDIVKSRGQEIDAEKLSKRLGVPVQPTSMKSGQGKKELMSAAAEIANSRTRVTPSQIDYREMEAFIRELMDELSREPRLREKYPMRWLAVKLMEGDRQAQSLLEESHSRPEQMVKLVSDKRAAFEAAYGEAPEQHIAQLRYQAAADVARSAIKTGKDSPRPWSDRIDSLVCNRFLGPIILVGIIYLLYYLSIVQGYNVTNYTWPLLAKLRSLVEGLAPAPGLHRNPPAESLSSLVC